MSGPGDFDLRPTDPKNNRDHPLNNHLMKFQDSG